MFISDVDCSTSFLQQQLGAHSSTRVLVLSSSFRILGELDLLGPDPGPDSCSGSVQIQQRLIVLFVTGLLRTCRILLVFWLVQTSAVAGSFSETRSSNDVYQPS